MTRECPDPFPAPTATRVANHQEDAPKTAATQREDISALPPLVIGCSSDLARPSRTRGPPLRRQERGQQSIVPSDFALIPKVLNEFDACEHTGTDKLGNKKSLVDIVTQLAARPHEEEWFEFKTNWCEPRILGSMYPPSPTPFSLAQTHTEARRLSGGTPSDRSS